MKKKNRRKLILPISTSFISCNSILFSDFFPAFVNCIQCAKVIQTPQKYPVEGTNYNETESTKLAINFSGLQIRPTLYCISQTVNTISLVEDKQRILSRRAVACYSRRPYATETTLTFHYCFTIE